MRLTLFSFCFVRIGGSRKGGRAGEWDRLIAGQELEEGSKVMLRYVKFTSVRSFIQRGTAM